jgi:AAA+ ATPase superfamily predicted ATPase
MDLFSQSVYVSEVAKQCQFAVGAVGQLNHALKSLQESRTEPERRNFFHSEVFRSIHSFLTHTSNISRLLWPAMPKRGNGESDEAYEMRLSSKPAILRARALRASLRLPDEHVLKSRRLRDLLEHFDEKLDEWRSTSVHRNIVNDFIGPKNGIVGIAETDMMRWFDPSSNSFTFRGETFDLQALATATSQLLPLAKKTEEQLRGQMINEMRAMHNQQLKPTQQGGAA